MKKMMLLALSMVASTMVYAHGWDYSESKSRDTRYSWQQMSQTHELMHGTSMSQERLEKGVLVRLTGESETATELIKKRIIDDGAALEKYFEGVTVAALTLEDGVELTLETTDERRIKQLQRNSSRIIYSYLHGDVGGKYMGHGHHRGYGHGMMHGWGARGGMGPGMMYENWNESESNNSRWDNHMGYGYGGM